MSLRQWKWWQAGFIFFLLLAVATILFLGARIMLAPRVVLAQYDSQAGATRYLTLPVSGANFKASSVLAYGVGRYYLKGAVAATILAAYDRLAQEQPQYRYLYAEMGWQGGGRFRPHRTHMQGISADFITPVFRVDGQGSLHPATLPVSIFNLWGYKIRLDAQGRYGDYRLDTSAMIAHLHALQEAGKPYRVRIVRVIFDPPLLALLRKNPSFTLLQGMVFMEKAAWFPHDSHYHVDFEIY